MDWLKEVINNKDIKDDALITLAGGKTVSMGDIRSLTTKQQSALAKAEEELAARKQDLDKQFDTLRLAQAETARLFTQLEEQRKGNPAKANEPDPLENLLKDPVIGPMAKRVQDALQAIDKIQTSAIAPIIKAQQDMAAAYVNDRLEDLYERTVPDAKKKDISLEAILKVANDNGLKTRTGIPDIRKAYSQMTTKPVSQEDLDAQIKAAEQRGREAAMQETRDKNQIRVARPNFGSSRNADGSQFTPTKLDSVSSALDEALAAAAKDADIWKSIDAIN